MEDFTYRVCQKRLLVENFDYSWTLDKGSKLKKMLISGGLNRLR